MTDHNTIDRTQLFSLDPDWFYQVIIRRLRRADLPALEWEGEFTRFRNVYAEVYKRMHDGVAYMWGADLPDSPPSARMKKAPLNPGVAPPQANERNSPDPAAANPLCGCAKAGFRLTLRSPARI